ncbi:glycoside hydrolase family 99-like domain-containing protein, partial [[Clostridium] symbiosum]
MRVSYDIIWKQILSRRDMEGAFLGAFVDWDNSPRKSYNATVITGATPEKFGEYMCKLMKKAQELHSPVIVINAWNEWAEGAFLEPDKEYGTAYLEQISKFAERKSVYNGRTE